MNLNENANIGIDKDSLEKNIVNMISVHQELESKLMQISNKYYLYEDTFNGLDFLKDNLKEMIDDINNINTNNQNKIIALKSLVNKYDDHVQITNSNINSTTKSLETL